MMRLHWNAHTVNIDFRIGLVSHSRLTHDNGRVVESLEVSVDLGHADNSRIVMSLVGFAGLGFVPVQNSVRHTSQTGGISCVFVVSNSLKLHSPANERRYQGNPSFGTSSGLNAYNAKHNIISSDNRCGVAR
jgi:hypothetical protein